MEKNNTKSTLKKAFPVGTFSNETNVTAEAINTPNSEINLNSSNEAPKIGIVLPKRKKIPMSTLTLRYPTQMEESLEEIVRSSGLDKSKIVVSILEQALPELKKAYCN